MPRFFGEFEQRVSDQSAYGRRARERTDSQCSLFAECSVEFPQHQEESSETDSRTSRKGVNPGRVDRRASPRGRRRSASARASQGLHGPTKPLVADGRTERVCSLCIAHAVDLRVTESPPRQGRPTPRRIQSQDQPLRGGAFQPSFRPSLERWAIAYAMDDAGAMRCPKGARNPNPDFQRLVERQCAFLQPLFERFRLPGTP
jgi:hypothetical protein